MIFYNVIKYLSRYTFYRYTNEKSFKLKNYKFFENILRMSSSFINKLYFLFNSENIRFFHLYCLIWFSIFFYYLNRSHGRFVLVKKKGAGQKYPFFGQIYIIHPWWPSHSKKNFFAASLGGWKRLLWIWDRCTIWIVSKNKKISTIFLR